METILIDSEIQMSWASRGSAPVFDASGLGAMVRKPVAISFSACSGVRSLWRRRDHFVAGQLLADELVERLVRVERLDHVVAVAEGVLADRVVGRVAV